MLKNNSNHAIHWAYQYISQLAGNGIIRLNYYRVDRISGGDNDRHKTERVRLNNEPRNERDVYGSRISQ